MKITELKSNEGGLHYYNKSYLMDWIINKEIIFQDQEGYRFYIDINRMEFGSMESYVYEKSGEMEPYSSGQCFQCFSIETEEQLDELLYNKFTNSNREWNKNILTKDKDYEYFKSHPCNFCKYKGVANCIFIFDIAFSHKGKIEVAVEVNNTSPVKWNKIKFCKENNITLIQVGAKAINYVTQRENKIIPCEVLNINNSVNSVRLKYIK